MMKGCAEAIDNQTEKFILLSKVIELEELSPKLFRSEEIIKALASLADEQIAKTIRASVEEIENAANDIDEVIYSIYGREDLDRKFVV